MKFSLGALLALFSGVAIYFGIVFGMPIWLGVVGLSVCSFLMGPVIVTGMIYARGYSRTFWIGCATAAAVPYIFLGYFVTVYSMQIYWDSRVFESTGDRSSNYAFVACHLIIGASGLVAVASRRWLVERKRPLPASTGAIQCQASVEHSPTPFRES